MSHFFIDISQEYLAVNVDDKDYISNIEVDTFWENPKLIIEDFKNFLETKSLSQRIEGLEGAVVTVPIKALNHQMITLPEDDEISEENRLILLGLELDRAKITNRFNYQRLPVTQRTEGDSKLCDYMVISLKPTLYEKINAICKPFKIKLLNIVPSFFFLSSDFSTELTASALLEKERTDVVIWGHNDPLAIGSIPNAGDPAEDINRFIRQFFDQISGLKLSRIKLFGPGVDHEDTKLNNLSHEYTVSEEDKVIPKSLPNALGYLDISQKTKLPRAPLSFTPRNIVYLSSGALVAILILVTIVFTFMSAGLSGKIDQLQVKANKNKKIYVESKQLEKKKVTLEREKEFYLDITKRRTPWSAIFTEFAKLTPWNLWIERLNSNKTGFQITGKARKPEDVSAFSINLNNNSTYFTDAKIIGVRDFEQAGRTYTEFQLNLKLHSPTGELIKVPK